MRRFPKPKLLLLFAGVVLADAGFTPQALADPAMRRR
jgi:hypothetical protein